MDTVKANKLHRYVLVVICLLAALLLTSPAHAFRCGNRIVIKNMQVQQVRKACGDPTIERHLGFTVRAVEPPRRRGLSTYSSVSPHATLAYFTQEVAVTEYIYNFGPRKFMRRLVFEGGILVSIETIGYGYRESRE